MTSKLEKMLKPEQIDQIIENPDYLVKIIKQEVKKEKLHQKNIYKQ